MKCGISNADAERQVARLGERLKQTTLLPSLLAPTSPSKRPENPELF